MTREDRATAFVRRTNAALQDLDRSEQIWTESVRSSTEEIRLHGLTLDLDNGIRRVTGPFDTWAGFDPLQVPTVREKGPVNLLWVLSCHPSGRVREAVVHATQDLANDRILPHLANRAVDFVPQIRELAGPLVVARIDDVLAGFSGPDRPDVLPTPVHIAVNKLLAPRTAMVSPLLVHRCIDLATAAAMAYPRSFRGGGKARMLDRCYQTLEAAIEPESIEALNALIAHFERATPTS